jgi:hypothetical protein
LYGETRRNDDGLILFRDLKIGTIVSASFWMGYLTFQDGEENHYCIISIIDAATCLLQSLIIKKRNDNSY